MAKYDLKKIDNIYTIWANHILILTPAGNPFITREEHLASLLYDDICAFGPDPLKSLSYVTLHASYIDFGLTVDSAVLKDNILIGYKPDWDIALALLENFESRWRSLSFFDESDNKGVIIDPQFFFGPPEDISSVDSWLKGLSKRGLSSVQVCGATFSSILLCFRLFQNDPKWPTDLLAMGIFRASRVIHPFLFEKNNRKATEKNIATFLDKVRLYASFPDENLPKEKFVCSK